MSAYTAISIIYNPKSTGSSRDLATELRDDLLAAGVTSPVELVATESAGHAETLAYDLANASSQPLIISSSGDGGYHEVINGLIKAQQEGAQPVAGLLPAGNANDHYENLHDQDLVTAIIGRDERRIDLLKLTTRSHGKPFERYAHSYIGMGLTPKVGRELNKTKLNPLNQVWIVLKVLLLLRPIKVRIDGKAGYYDSIIISNVSKMSKVLTTAAQAEIDDGLFELSLFRRRSKFRLIWRLLQATTTKALAGRTARQFICRTTKPLIVQADGEIIPVDGDSDLQISVAPAVLHCII